MAVARLHIALQSKLLKGCVLRMGIWRIENHSEVINGLDPKISRDQPPPEANRHSTLLSSTAISGKSLVSQGSFSQLKSAQEPDTKTHDKTKILKKSQRTVLSWILFSGS